MQTPPGEGEPPINETGTNTTNNEANANTQVTRAEFQEITLQFPNQIAVFTQALTTRIVVHLHILTKNQPPPRPPKINK